MLVIAIVGALALASVPLIIGWRRTASEADMVRSLGLSTEKRKFDFKSWALQTGTGLKPNQILIGMLIWTAGGFTAGFLLSPFSAILFGVVGFLFYRGTLDEKRQVFRLKQSKDILRALNVMDTLLSQGRNISEALEQAAESVGPEGRMVLSDLVTSLRSASLDVISDEIRKWTVRWNSPGVDILGTALITYYESRIEVSPLINSLRKTLSDVVEVLSRARAASAGTQWQVRFLAIFPIASLVLSALTSPGYARIWSDNPVFLLPVLLGCVASYTLSMKMINDGLSIEASVGLTQSKAGEIPVALMNRLL